MIIRTGADVATLLDQAQIGTWVVPNEIVLQGALEELLALHNVPCAREVRLSDDISRIDMMLSTADDHGLPALDLGIEVKIKGSAADVLRQLTRYAKCPEIRELVLITTKAVHTKLPHEILGKTLTIVPLLEGGL
ncbi:hypothetical protein [Glaciihabitans sp. dw_435]|uniref:hypothetical protein n=1 Tax=Glaciihabitans sp. dw_435 TaxID=2720081 RepID=UPI001BD26079|nr:hypothetical protein [Glaciihabitans sp. dw_435]